MRTIMGTDRDISAMTMRWSDGFVYDLGSLGIVYSYEINSEHRLSNRNPASGHRVGESARIVLGI
jgi:hypothetical protein